MSASDTAYSPMLTELRQHFDRGLTRDLAWRREQLNALITLLDDNQAAIDAALRDDLAKPAHETLLGELTLLYAETKHALSRLKKWSRMRRVHTPAFAQPGRSWVQPEPLGVVLIIGAWNYPIQLSLAPLIPALAAGNAAIIKPSELAPASSKLLAELVPKYFDARAVRVVEGGQHETTALLTERFDHIVYTGGGRVGRIVMKAAAEHLTPVTLELGGKSPAVVDDSADIASAARRIIWGKCLNAGQTCIAPDYVLVSRRRHDALIEAMQASLQTMFGDDRLHSVDYCRIINRHHFERLKGLLGDGRVVIGGASDEATQRIEPTVITDLTLDAPVMREEIFGPILPVIVVEDIEQAIATIKQGDKPLAAYVFARDRQVQQRFIDQVSCGSLCINDTLMFMSVPDLPFGGVGPSGMGQYHGQVGFDRLSHLKAVMRRGRFPEIPVRFAPYTAFKTRLLRWLA
jgi:aldehyde dehydrogenase (NAD+)